MGAFANRFIALGKRLISKYGDNIVVVHRYDCVYVPSEGKDVCTEDLYPYKAQISAFTIAEASTDNVSVDDIRMIIPTAALINKEWEVQYDGKVWSIIDIVKVRTQDNTIIQTLQARVLT